jgi:hypothetical protein
VSPVISLPEKDTSSFYRMATPLARLLSGLFLDEYNKQLVIPQIDRSFKEHFVFAIGVQSIDDPSVGKVVQGEALSDRSSERTANPLAELIKERLDGPGDSLIVGSQKQVASRYFTNMAIREPALNRLAGYSDTSAANRAPIYGACRLSVFEEAAAIAGLAYEPGGRDKKPSTSAILSSELAAEFGPTY